jgi:acetate kinase
VESTHDVPVRVLVVNAGSSSLKLSLLDGGDVVARSDGDELATFVAKCGDVDAVGHRVVHGGVEFSDPTVVDDGVLRALAALTPLAPIHQPRAIALIRDAREVLPDVPQVACFDTAFHATMPAEASTYALPKEWREHWPVRRFGFHGLSHAYASREAARRLGRAEADLALVTAHLGAGASLCAVLAGRSIDTTMGMTPLEGLVMATRAGSIDPGISIWVQQYGNLAPGPVQHALEEESGLVGLCGTGDMREVLRRRADGDADAVLAFDVYVHQLRRELGAMVASLGRRPDAIVYTGGVGENAVEVRDAASAGFDAPVLVVEAREDLEIARAVTTTIV